MAESKDYLIKDTTLIGIADAIRNKTGKNNAIPTVEMADRINSIVGQEYIITVNVDSGATVKLTNGDRVVTGVSENGACVLKVDTVGDWTAIATLEGSESTTRTVGVFNNYSTTLVFFTAPVTVNTSAGAVVTAKKDNITLTQTADSTGACHFVIREPGTYQFTAVEEERGVEKSIEISEETAYVVELKFFNAPVAVNTSAGATVKAVKDDITIEKTADTYGICNFIIKYPGSWTFSATKEDKTMTETVEITDTTPRTIYFALDMMTLNVNSWETISQISEAGTGRNYWSVGDCKAVHLSGTMGTLALDETLWVYILGFDHNEEEEGTGITFGGFKTNSGSSGINVCLVDSNYGSSSSSGTKYFNMDHFGGGYNYGGWARCDMRYDILGSTDQQPDGYGSIPASGQVGYEPSSTCATSPVENTLMSCLPEDLRHFLKPMTKYTDNVGGGTNTETNITVSKDYLPLLAEFEVFGRRNYANSYEQSHQKQYEYFSAGNSKVKYRHSATGSSAWWWERSPFYSSSNRFCRVTSNGGANLSNAYYSGGVAPAFMI